MATIPVVRERLRADLDSCVSLLRTVHQRDGYPLNWPADPTGWITAPDALAGWVAEHAGVLAGHVVLRPAAGPMVPVWEQGTGLPADRMGVVSRLFSDPDRRGSGIGTALLAAAVTEARRRRLLPVLDVLTRDEAAARLYEKLGWTRLGRFVWDMPDGSREPAFAYGLM